MTMTLPEKTPLEILMVAALKFRRRAEEHEAKAEASGDPQWRLYHAREAANERAAEQYNLDHAWEHAALFIDAETAQ